MMLVRFLRLKDRTSEEVASEKLNPAEKSFEDFIEDVAVLIFRNGEELLIVSCLWRVP